MSPVNHTPKNPRSARLAGAATIVFSLALGAAVVAWNHHRGKTQLAKAESERKALGAAANPLPEGQASASATPVPESALEGFTPPKKKVVNSGFGMITGSKSIGRNLVQLEPESESKWSKLPSRQPEQIISPDALMLGSKSFTPAHLLETNPSEESSSPPEKP